VSRPPEAGDLEPENSAFLLADVATGAEWLPVLKDSDQRIRSLRARLHAWEPDSPSPARANEADASTAIEVVCHTEDAVTTGMWRAELDRAAVRAISQCVFPKLEDLEGAIEQCASFEELRDVQLKSGRKAFPRHFLRHPGVVLLTDHVMGNAYEFQKAASVLANDPTSRESKVPQAPPVRKRPTRASVGAVPAPRSRSAPTVTSARRPVRRR